MKESNNPSDQHAGPGLKLAENTLSRLGKTAKWTIFIAILGFITIFLMIASAISLVEKLTDIARGGHDVSILIALSILMPVAIAGIILFFPMLFLLNFGLRLKKGLAEKNEGSVYQGIRQLNAYFKYIAILGIIVGAVYLLALILINSLQSFGKLSL